MGVVTLGTGEEVHFKERFTHADEIAFSTGRRKGVVERQYVSDDGKMIVERSPDNIDSAIEETLLVLIEKVKDDTGERRPTREWLGGLSEPDYEELTRTFVDIRKESRLAAETGKKNRG